MFTCLLLQVSLLVQPLHLGESPPESRAVRALLVAPDPRLPGDPAPRREAASALAKELVRELGAGADFDALAARARAFSSESGGGVLGTYFPGVLAPAVDEFLFRADEFAVSGVLDSPAGFQVVQRIDRLAGCRAILVAGKDEAARGEARELLARLKAGADFAALARERSADTATAASGGALGIFERGPSDALLKAAAFRLKPGEVGGPIESPLGLHLLQRVEPSTLDPGLADDTVARVRLLLVAFARARGAGAQVTRDPAAAEQLARSLHARIVAGEDLAELAAAHDDDPGGRARRGDAGWIRRRTSQIDPKLDRAFTLEPGATSEPFATDAGWLIVRRER